MKRSLADKIEQYIKVLIERSGEGQIEIQRAELAETFRCVPSQVTYVISTRFSQEEGYLTESRRGGKGFVRITRRKDMNSPLAVTQQQLAAFARDLLEKELIGEREYDMLIYLFDYTFNNLEPRQQSELRLVIQTALARLIDSGPH